MHGVAGKPLTLIAHDEFGNVAKVESSMHLAKAEKQPLTTERLREQLGRLGGTPFKLGELKNCLVGEVLLPVSELNRLRREIVTELERLRAQPKQWTLNSGGTGVAPETAKQGPAVSSPHCHPQSTSHDEIRRDAEFNPRDAGSTLIALVRNLPQLEAALSCGVTTIYCEFEDPKKYREAVTLFHTAFVVALSLNPQLSTLSLPSGSLPRAFSSRARNGRWSRCVPATPTAIWSAITIT